LPWQQLLLLQLLLSRSTISCLNPIDISVLNHLSWSLHWISRRASIPDEIIDANVDEKHRRDEILHRRVRPRLDKDEIIVQDHCSITPGRDATANNDSAADTTMLNAQSAAPKKY
jgi:hypothetical protein